MEKLELFEAINSVNGLFIGNIIVRVSDNEIKTCDIGSYEIDSAQLSQAY